MENIYITWHYTTHGIAYLKHVLSAFYTGKARLDQSPIAVEGLSQEEMNEVFSQPPSPSGFLFDKVYYLYYREEVQAQGSSRRYWRSNTLALDVLFQETKTDAIWKEAFDTDRPMREEIPYFKKTYPKQYKTLLQQYWRCIHHYTVEDQFYWYRTYSNAQDFYPFGERFVPVFMSEINDLRDHQQIGVALLAFLSDLRKKHPRAQLIINISLGSYEAQNVWYVLAEADRLPPLTRFITTYDRKDDPAPRFKKFEIKEKPTKILGGLSNTFRFYETTQSKSRRLAFLKMETYLKQGFAILLIGERGTGKSRIVEERIEAEKRKNWKFPHANASCASFDDDSKAESELFGYYKGAFTGANTDKQGLFHQAKGGILFLDEVHLLSKMVQGKLMRALQTNEKNEFSIRRVNSTSEEKIQCTLICATNKTIEELRECLLPDLYDRISQLVIEFPPLRDTPEDRMDDWKGVWSQLQFDQLGHECPQRLDMRQWLTALPLHGNFRDLQKIAIYYKAYLDLPEDAKDLLPEKTAFDFAKAEFERYYSKQTAAATPAFFRKDKTGDEMVVDFKRALAQWAQQESDAPHQLLQIAQKTFYNWKNAK